MISASSLRFWAWPTELRRAGVLGMNRRNLELLTPLNPRRFYPRVDNKAVTKEICHAHAIPSPETYATIRRFGDIHGFPHCVGERREFVIKPACGAAGRGVVVIADRTGGGFVTSSSEVLTPDDLRYHLSTTLSGLYSLAGRLDCALIEQRLHIHPVFDAIAVQGTPDIRVITCRATPVMAMVRLPTRQSRGRANLHQGAVGAGVDMGTGCTLDGVYLGGRIDVAPDTGAPISGVQIPCWPEILEIAKKLSRILELGYIGIDLVLDADFGPMVLEANARPGLAIQLANACGLMGRVGHGGR